MSALRRPNTAPAATDTPLAVVIGGGISGLVAARELALTGHRVVVAEAGALGGRVTAHTVDSLVLDAGAESFATRNPSVSRLARELGLDVVLPSESPAWLHAGPGRDIPLPRTGIFGIPGDPLAADVVAALGRPGAERAAEDLDLPVDPSLLKGNVSLGHLVRERLGQAALDTLVAPVVSGVHSADPDVLDADAIAPGLRAALAREGSLCRAAASLRAAAPAGSAVAGLDGGMNTLTTALLEDLRERGVTLLDHTVIDTVELAEGIWHVASGTDTLEADRLVVATDGPTAVDLLAGSVPGLAALRPAKGAGVTLVTLVVDQPVLDEAPRGTGVLVAPDATDVVAKALTHSTAKWPWLAREAGPGRHAVRLSYGRTTDAAARMADAKDAVLTKQAIADAAVLLGVPLSSADVLGSDVIRHPGALPMATEGHRALLDAAAVLLRGVEHLDVIGAWRSGTGLTPIVAATRAQLGISAS
ncbi:protoporphyrinogen/coproporphyrinogen oxidase [Galactobacter caseinivorans]|uniref:FAD-dependent oxidoreductase n=1 Tax=Galactobacter caseinivorans TaxID=2676123 RepID=A0A496PM59_9MICC|nr:FAD-dependent oxidoreductase [Galactobacter caseinivorans]RKW71607.1 FAD-dependent oxidoreductase [Galactobacter caseinivorans]